MCRNVFEYFPDGLDEASIDRLIAEVDAELLIGADFFATTPSRRKAHQRLGGVVRVLRTQQSVSRAESRTEAA